MAVRRRVNAHASSCKSDHHPERAGCHVARRLTTADLQFSLVVDEILQSGAEILARRQELFPKSAGPGR